MVDVVSKLAYALTCKNIDADDLFFELDVNRDDCVSYSELLSVFVNLDANITQSDCVSAFQQFDTDGNGYVSLQEFRDGIRRVSVQAVHPMNTFQPSPSPLPLRHIEEQLIEKTMVIFKQFDSDDNGFIDYLELTSALQRLDQARWTPERILQLMRELALNGENRIRFEEFHRWAISGCEDSAALLRLDMGPARELEQATTSALDLASRGQWPDVLRLLTVHQNSFVNVVGGEYALLHHACDQGRTDVLHELFGTHCASPIILTGSGKTAAAVAESRGHNDAKDRVHIAVAKTVISWAAEQKWTHVMDALGMNPAVVNILPPGYTHRLLHYAASQGKAEIVSTLVHNFGADPELAGEDGRLPVDLAMQMRHLHIVAHLPRSPAANKGGLIARSLADPSVVGPVSPSAQRRAAAAAAAAVNGVTGADGSLPLDATLQQLLGMVPEPRWGHGDTDGEESDDEEGAVLRRGFSGMFARTPRETSSALREHALQQIASLRLAGSLHGARLGRGPLGLIADINYGNLWPSNHTTTSRKNYDVTLQTFEYSIHTFNQLQCVGMVLLGDQIDKRDKTGADVAAASVLTEAAKFHIQEHVCWLLGHHDTQYSRYFQQQRKAAATDPTLRGAFCYEFAKLGEDGSSWRFFALDAYAVVSEDTADGYLWRREGRDVDERVRLHGAIGLAQLNWLDRRLDACQADGHRVCIMSHSALHCKKFLTSPPDRSSVGLISCVVNSREVLQVLRKYSCVKLVLSGHDHRGAHYQDTARVHHISLPACVSEERGKLSGTLLWTFSTRVALDFLVGPGKSCARLVLTLS